MEEGGGQEEVLWRAREKLSKRHHHQPDLSESHILFVLYKKSKKG